MGLRIKRPTDRAAVSPRAEETEARRAALPAWTLWSNARKRKARKHANVALVRARGCTRVPLGESEVCTQTNVGCGPRREQPPSSHATTPSLMRK